MKKRALEYVNLSPFQGVLDFGLELLNRIQFVRVIRKEFMDQYSEMKGFYIVMDSVPIHTADAMDEMIARRGYEIIYLPPYSPELNPMENFWFTMKSYVKRSKFGGIEDLKTRVAEVSNGIRASALLSLS